MKILVDENVRKEVSDFLVSSGHDVIHPTPGTSDREILDVAVSEGRIILTHDLDFSDIFLYPPQEHSGIIVMRIQASLKDTTINALTNLFNSISEDEYNGRLIILEPHSFRTRGVFDNE